MAKGKSAPLLGVEKLMEDGTPIALFPTNLGEKQ